MIAFEGPDGSGKSTIIKQLQTRMEERHLPVMVGRQPGGTPAGEAIREIILDPNVELDAISQVYLLMASRTEFLEQRVRPALLAGETVLCDRLDLSTIFYQTVVMKYKLIDRYGISTDTAKQVMAFHKKVNEISRDSHGDIPLRYIIMDADDQVLNDRRPRSATDRFESQEKGFQKDMRSFYRQYAGANRNNPDVRVVNSNSPIGTPELDALIDWIQNDDVVLPTKITT
jgi:dTMP kinase